MVIVARALRNLGRNPGKTVLLTAVLAVVVAVGIVGMAVEAGARDGIQDVRRNLGNEVRLSPNVGDMRGRIAGGLRLGQQFAVADIPVVTEELTNILAESGYVVETDRTLRGSALGESIQPVDEGAGGIFDLFRGGAQQYRPGFVLTGNALPTRIQDFAGGRRVLVEGRLYSTEEVAARARVAIIDEVLAAGNELTLGSTFVLRNRPTDELLEFAVIGICRDQEVPEADLQTGQGGMVIRAAMFGGANTMYMPYTAIQDMIARPGEIASASFYLDDPEHVEAFRSEAEAAGLDTEKFMLWSSDAQYDVMAGPLMKLAGFARTGVVAVVVAGAMVICLLMTIVTRERKLEIGLLRALGATRRAVASQLGIETLTVALVGLVLGVMVGGIVAQTAADQLLAREVALVQNTGLGQAFMGRGGLSVFRMPFMTGSAGMPVEIRAMLGPAELGAMLGVSLLLALIGSLVAVFWSMKMHPASILASRT
ncbi:MAG: ABC transporter permease [Bacillota bacterium]|nr:ABC transporter permease [Bacillota bacterium]